MSDSSRASFSVGHWTDPTARTGCTVILFDRLVPAVVDVRGGAPGTRETDLLAGDRLVGQADAILLTGGSAFGLAAADGVMRFLRERGRGFPTSAGPVPIVPSAVIFDLAVGQPVWPTADAGFAACQVAAPVTASGTGAIGAGAGATCRKLWSAKPPRPGGFGWATVEVANSVALHAMAVVNAVGDIRDEEWVDERSSLLTASPSAALDERSATTLVSVVVDGECDHRTLRRLAISAHDAMARVIVPCHTLFDGDVVFAAQTGRSIEFAPHDALQLSVATELAVEEAITIAVRRS